MEETDLDQFKRLFDASLETEQEFTQKMIDLNEKLKRELAQLKEDSDGRLDNAISIIESIIATVKSTIEGHNTRIQSANPMTTLEEAEESFRAKLRNLFEESEVAPATNNESTEGPEGPAVTGGGKKKTRSMVESDSDSDHTKTYGGFASDDGDMYGGGNGDVAFYFSGGEVYSSDESDQSN